MDELCYNVVIDKLNNVMFEAKVVQAINFTTTVYQRHACVFVQLKEELAWIEKTCIKL